MDKEKLKKIQQQTIDINRGTNVRYIVKVYGKNETGPRYEVRLPKAAILRLVDTCQMYLEDIFHNPFGEAINDGEYVWNEHTVDVILIPFALEEIDTLFRLYKDQTEAVRAFIASKL